ncbi:unannotated protein [freshwater metagenome]|uniref:Unannotated protein n=1 Tax=freshwater metagenome TaxID=449393 RepID=A0A6J7EVX3_9ZZZZ
MGIREGNHRRSITTSLLLLTNAMLVKLVKLAQFDG